MNRRELLGGLSTLALASCSGNSLPLEAINSKSAIAHGGVLRTRMSLPSGYTTSTSSSGSVYTTNLYYLGTLIAALSANTANWETTFYDYVSNQQWTSTSPSGLVAGQTWNMASNASGTANSSGTQLSGVCGDASGYFYRAVDSSTDDYYSEHYHPTFYSAVQRTYTTISSGASGNGGCPKSGCLNSPPNKSHVHANSVFECVTGIVGVGFGAVGMAASIAGMFTGALTPLAVGGLVSSHIALLWGIAMVYGSCM